jgi:hypothetical protein
MHDSFIHDTNKEILKYIPYEELFQRLESYKSLNAKNSPSGMELMDFPTILYIINTPVFEENEEELINKKDQPEAVMAFVRKHYPRINSDYDGGLYKLLNTGSKKTMPVSYCFAPSSEEEFRSLTDKTVTIERLAKTNSILEKRIDPGTKEEYLLQTKIIKKTDSPRELDPDPKKRKELLGEENKDFFIKNKNAINITTVTKRLLLYVLKQKVGLENEDISNWFEYYGFQDYPEYQYISREIKRHINLFKSSN